MSLYQPPIGGDDAPLLVVGAGAAGMACALAAARGGVRVVLAERLERSGGTVADALIHTIGGLFDDQGEAVSDGLPAELANRLRSADPYSEARRIGRTHVLNVDPAVYRAATDAWLREEPLIERVFGVEIGRVKVEDGAVAEVGLRQRGRTTRVRPAAVVDATGDAALVRRVDPSLVEPGEALAGLVVELRGAEPDALAFPKGVALIKVARAAAAKGELPATCASLWPDTGVAPGEVYLKFNLDAEAFDEAAFHADLARFVAWLRGLPGLANAEVNRVGALGIRDGGRIRGRYRLTEDDVRSGKRFADAVGQGCWPIEHWHPTQGVKLDYLPPGTRYDIPLGALTVRGFHGLYAAGKCLSAEPRAQASARVAGTCWAMGGGLGRKLGESRFATPAAGYSSFVFGV